MTVITRRQVATGAGGGLIGSALVRIGVVQAANAWSAGLSRELARIEAEIGGRLGVAVLDTAMGQRADHRGEERFPLCSTFKVLAASAILARVDKGQEQLSRRIRFEAKDVVENSPITKDRVGGDGMTLAEFCEAAITMSDNTAGNMLLSAIGGPSGLTAYVRSLGDGVTRLDRIETALNEALPGDPRDTTSPVAMAGNLHRLVLGDALLPASKEKLIAWLVGNKTGDTRLRAGLPSAWRVGDKTGSGERGTANDVAVIWPAQRKPVIVAAYLTGTEASAEQRSAALAAVGRAVTAATSP
jgi:beta-lactamase class A